MPLASLSRLKMKVCVDLIYPASLRRVSALSSENSKLASAYEAKVSELADMQYPLESSMKKVEEYANLIKDLNRVVKEQREKIDNLCRFHNDAAETFQRRILAAEKENERVCQLEIDLQTVFSRKEELERAISQEESAHLESQEKLKAEHSTITKALQEDVSSMSDVCHAKISL